MSIHLARRKPLKRAVHLRSLEQRFMFDGAAVVDASHAAQAAAADAASIKSLALPPGAVEVRAADPTRDQGRKEAVFIDTSLGDYKTLEAAVADGKAIIEFDGLKDGLAQIAGWAASHAGYDAIHILSHGSEGLIRLGSTALTLDALRTEATRTELSLIGSALHGDGDLLFYGCDIGAGPAGQALVTQLASLTGADVAASTDATGAARLGGNWTLEAQTGHIDVTGALDAAGISAYAQLLTTVTFVENSLEDSQGTLTPFDRTIGGATFTFSAGSTAFAGAYFDIGLDATSGLTGIYALSQRAGQSGVDFTVSVQSGYTFDLTGFKMTATASPLVVYYNGMVSNQSYVVTTDTIVTFSSLTDFNDVTSVTFTTTNFSLFQDLEITDVKQMLPTVTDARISLSGASGTGGAYKIGDTVTATWNNTTGGDNNSGITGVTMDFSQFGGGSAVTASNSSNTWTATYTIVSGAIDTTSRNVSVTATNAGGSTTTADTTNATVDNIAPTVSDANVSLSGASGTGGAYKIGDTVTATWNNTGGGDGNSDTISSVTVDFSQFGGGSAVSASNSSGTWTATYAIVAGAINGTTNRNVSVTATDNAGNTTTRADTSNVTVDNAAPTTSVATKAFSNDTGSSSTDFITSNTSQTISGTLSANLATGEAVLVSLDNGSTWTAAAATVGQSTWSLSGQTLSGNNTLKVKVQDGAGNDGTVSSQAYTLDTSAPSAPSTPDMTSGTDSGTSNSDNITSNTTPTFTGTAESGSTVTLYDTDGSTVLGTATATGGNWSITSSSLSAGSHTLTAKATDTAGNTSSASSGLAITIDTSAPTGLTLDSTTISSANATSSATIATLSATDGLSITYSLATGNGTNDADNGSFTISGTSLRVGGAALTAGTYKLYVAATDTAGNVANQAFTLTVVDAPSVSSIVRTGAASATVAGSASSISYTVTFDQAVTGVDASDFALTATGTASGSIASVSGSGTTYTVTVDTLAGDGTLRLDLNNSGTGIQNGNSVAILSGYTSGSTYTLDHTAPNAPSTPDLATGSDSGSSSSDNITSASAPTFTGTAESGSTVTLYDTDGSTVLGTGTATGGNWSITTSTLSSGSHTLTAKASDAAGNVSTASSGLSVTIDTTAPTVASVSVPGNGLYKAGDTLSFTINTDEAVTVDTSGGTPRLALDVGGTTVYASYVSGSGSSALVFSYTVQAGDTDTDGITVGTLQANGGTLTDTAGNSMTLTLNSVGSTSNVLIDTTGPTVAAVSVPGNGTYVDGSTLDFTVQFDEAVSVDTTGGTPRIALTIGSSTVYASYLSGSGSSSLVFRYTVQAGQQDVDGITVGSLTLNGGTLQDAATNGATLTLNSVGSTASVLANGLQPSITDVSASTANGSYKAGDTITITVDFSKAVTVDTTGGTPTLTLDDGGTATYTSGSGSSTLTFTHVIADGNNSADLDYSTTSALVLNGGGITDAGGTHQNAALTLATPGATHSLGANKAIVVDTTPPAISFSNLAFSADTGTSSSDFITRTAAQTITATLSSVPAGGDIVYGSLDNGATWTDITSKVSGTTLSWDGVTLVGSNTLKLKVSDSVGNDGTVASQAYVLDTTAPSITFSNLALSADTGVSSSDFITHTAAQTITATLSSAPAGSDIVYGSLDNGATWTDITSKVSGTTLSWDGVTLAGSNTLRLKVSDAAGNDGSATSQAYVLDTTAPTITVSGITLSNDSGASASDFITNVASQTISATLSAAPAGSDVVWGSLDNGATWANITAKVSGTSLQWDGVTLTSSSAIRIKVSDAAGNDGPVASQVYTFDNTAPTLPTFNNLSTTSTTPTLSGSASLGAGETMTITVEGGATYNVTPSGGLWQLDLATATPVSGTLALTVGRTFVVTVAVTDTAGNSATATGALNVAAPTPVIPTQPEPAAPPPPPAPTVVETPAAPPVVEPPSTFLSPATQAAILPTGSPDAIASRGAIVLPTVMAPSPGGLETPAPPPSPALTRGGEGLFQITVMPQRAGAPDSLLVNRPIPDQVLPSTGRIAFSVPADTFAQTNPDARVQLSATQANGQPLPSWLRFNPQTGRFEGTPPPGVRGELAIRLIARDAQGHEAASVFKVRMGGASRGAQSSPPDAGRPSLSEQIRLAAQRQARHTTHG